MAKKAGDDQSNPFQSPETIELDVLRKGEPKYDLRSIAMYQRLIIFCILGNFGCIASLIATNMLRNPAIGMFIGMTLLLMALVSLICVILLASKIYGVVIGIILGLFMWVPLLSLLILVMINGRATSILTKNGVHVGFLGADYSKL